MDITVASASFTFRVNPAGSRHVAPITLNEWAPFGFGNADRGHSGQDILLECPLVYGELEEGKLANRTAYARSLEYFLANRPAIQQSVLAACLTFVRDLHAMQVKYEVASGDLAHVNCADDLRPRIQLTYIELFPYQREALPYIGLTFECKWAEEGFLALLVGTDVLACGYPGSARAVDLSIRDDGGAI